MDKDILFRFPARRILPRSLFTLAAKDIFGNPLRFVTFTSIFFTSFLLIVISIAIFCGVCQHVVGIPFAAGAPIWVHPVYTKVMNIKIPLPEEALDKIRAMPGIKLAEPFTVAFFPLRLLSGKTFPAAIIAVPDETLAGLARDAEFEKEKFLASRTVLVNYDNYDSFTSPENKGVVVINDYNFQVCGKTRVDTLMDGAIIVYMKRSDFLSYVMQVYRNTNFILVWPSDDISVEQLCGKINETFSDVVAEPQEDYILNIIKWYLANVAIVQSFLIFVVIAVIFSLIVIVQNLSSFVSENKGVLGTLKVQGYSNADLLALIACEMAICLFFAITLGISVAALITFAVRLFPAFFFNMFPEGLVLAALVVVITAGISLLLSIRKFAAIELADAFK